MSIHKSLFIGGALESQRSVFTRRERLEALMREGRWEEGDDSVFGIPKVRTSFKVLSRKQKKAKEAAAEEATATAEGAASEGDES